jgi:hypothetical protein
MLPINAKSQYRSCRYADDNLPHGPQGGPKRAVGAAHWEHDRQTPVGWREVGSQREQLKICTAHGDEITVRQMAGYAARDARLGHSDRRRWLVAHHRGRG